MAGGNRRTRRHPEKWAQRRKMRSLVRWQRDNASLTSGSYSLMIERVGAALAEASPFFKLLADVVSKSLDDLILFGNTYLESAFRVPPHLMNLSRWEREQAGLHRVVMHGDPSVLSQSIREMSVVLGETEDVTARRVDALAGHSPPRLTVADYDKAIAQIKAEVDRTLAADASEPPYSEQTRWNTDHIIALGRQRLDLEGRRDALARDSVTYFGETFRDPLVRDGDR